MSSGAIFFFSFAIFQFGFAVFKTYELNSFNNAFSSLLLAGMAWAAGSVGSFFVSEGRRNSPSLSFVAGWGLFVGMLAWPWIAVGADGLSEFGLLLHIAVFALAGYTVPTLIVRRVEVPEAMRDAYTQSLFGAALGALLSAVTTYWLGIGVGFCTAAAAAAWAPLFEVKAGGVWGGRAKRASVLFALRGAIALGVAFVVPTIETLSECTGCESEAPAALVGAETAYRLQEGRGLSTYVIGASKPADIEQLVALDVAAGARNLTVVAEPTRNEAERRAQFKLPDTVTLQLEFGSGRRRIEAESRRFDLIQVLLPRMSTDGDRGRQFAEQALGTLTVEALQLYFSRLKDDGMLQIIGAAQGERAQSILTTVAEAWRRSARRDIDLHVVAVGTNAERGLILETAMVRGKPFSREERDRLEQLLGVGETRSRILPTDASGVVLADDRPFLREAAPTGAAAGWLGWAIGAAFIILLIGIALHERRKGVASKWQTVSVATYFGGLGLSFGFFLVFFVLRSIRAWGLPSIAMSLALAAILASLAGGSIFLAGHPKRRYGVRIQPLANFVFAVLFAYLGGSLLESFVASASDWIAAAVGMSVLIPFGLSGGSFVPNAIEEAGEKLHPRVLMLLWALHAVGMSLGAFAALSIALTSGLAVVFLGGLISFAWVAIVGGLIRPWGSRKLPTAESV